MGQVKKRSLKNYGLRYAPTEPRKIQRLADEMMRYFHENNTLSLDSFALYKHMHPMEFSELIHEDRYFREAFEYSKMTILNRILSLWEARRIDEPFAQAAAFMVLDSDQQLESRPSLETIKLNLKNEISH